MIGLTTLEIHKYVRTCPACRWEPPSAERFAALGELVSHVESFHKLGRPRMLCRNLPLAGAFDLTEVAVFGNFGF
jgi:hypothetical protein